MRVLPLTLRLSRYLTRHGMERAFTKQLVLFVTNPRHPSLHTEVLEPKHLGIYSFRVTKRYRALFVYCGDGVVEVIDINNHYTD